MAWDKMEVGSKYILANQGGSEEKPLRMTQIKEWNPLLLYSAKDGESLLQKSKLLKIQEIEQKVREFERWENVCLATSASDSQCSQDSFTSMLVFL
mmetsp:Transcript_4511/g.7690  ORF Transcript_4511/g.7690 Transcript_4511/m.7690 type:complete len:96 (+) Transcript_4511:428-715(+)